jgi:hypothetical protein
MISGFSKDVREHKDGINDLALLVPDFGAG